MTQLLYDALPQLDTYVCTVRTWCNCNVYSESIVQLHVAPQFFAGHKSMPLFSWGCAPVINSTMKLYLGVGGRN